MRRWVARDLARLRRRRWFRLAESFWLDRLTATGRAMLAVWLAASLLGQDLGMPIHLLWGFLTATLIFASFAAWLGLPRLEARVLPVTPTSAGRDLWIDLEVTNHSRRACNRLSAVAPRLPTTLVRSRLDAAIDRLEAGASTRARLPLTARRRGVYELSNLKLSSPFPFGLVNSFRPVPGNARVLVYPHFQTPSTFAVPTGRNHQPGGFLLSSQIGESAELMHTREYRPGDNPRHVHWPSTARLGEPVIKVYHEEYFARLALVIDTEVPAGTTELDTGNDVVALETGISTAAGIADYLSKHDYIIDLFAAGASVYHFQAGRALANFDSILEILSCVEETAEVDWTALEAAIIPQATRMTGVIAILMDWTSARKHLIDSLLAHGVGVRVIVVRAGDTTLPPPALPHDGYIQLAPNAETTTAATGQHGAPFRNVASP